MFSVAWLMLKFLQGRRCHNPCGYFSWLILGIGRVVEVEVKGKLSFGGWSGGGGTGMLSREDVHN